MSTIDNSIAHDQESDQLLIFVFYYLNISIVSEMEEFLPCNLEFLPCNLDLSDFVKNEGWNVPLHFCLCFLFLFYYCYWYCYYYYYCYCYNAT